MQKIAVTGEDGEVTLRPMSDLAATIMRKAMDKKSLHRMERRLKRIRQAKGEEAQEPSSSWRRRVVDEVQTL
jgi:hypothetical protein